MAGGQRGLPLRTMGRGAGKPQWQVIEVAAAFKAGEAALHAALQSSKQTKAASEYATWLHTLNADVEWQRLGHTFTDKKAGKEKDILWNVEQSIWSRQDAILKKHREIVAFCHKYLMPAYHTFYAKLGKPPSSGAEVAAAELAVKVYCWKIMEEERVAKLLKKAQAIGEVEAAMGASRGVDTNNCENIEPSAGEGHHPLSGVREMSEGWVCVKEYVVWRMFGPLAPKADQSASLL